jgi:hypothetical protein
MKTFEVRDAFFIRDDNETVGGTENNRHRQGSIFLKAANKAAALEVLNSFGYRVRPTECRLGMGNGMEALLEADVITSDTLTIVGIDGRQVGQVSFNELGERVAAHLGFLSPVVVNDIYAHAFARA